MKICIINNLFPPYNRGGAEIVAENQFNQLVNQGHDVFVITTKSENKKNIYSFYPFNIFSFYNLNKLPTPLRAIWRIIDLFNLHSYFKIKNILKKEKPDIVYCHNLTGLGYLVPRAIKTKYIQVMHDVSLIRPSGLLICNQEKENILIKLYSSITRKLFNSPDEIHFPSEWLKEYYTYRDFFPKSKKQVVRNFDIKIEKLDLKNKNNNFLFVGQIEKHKGILFLIKAFAQFQSDYKLNIVGTGSQLKKAKQLAKDNPNIIFHGYQPAEKFLAGADYIIVPSLCYENSPTIIFQSLKAKVPVIASNLGGISELVEDNKNGYLFKAGDQDSLLKTLTKTLNFSNIRI